MILLKNHCYADNFVAALKIKCDFFGLLVEFLNHLLNILDPFGGDFWFIGLDFKQLQVY